MAEPTKITAQLILDDLASKVLEDVKTRMHEAGAELDKLNKGGGAHGGGAKGTGGDIKKGFFQGIGQDFAHALREGAHMAAHEVADLIGEAFKAGAAELEEKKQLAGVLSMTDQMGLGFDMMTDKAGFFKDDLEDIGLKAGQTADSVQGAFEVISERSNKSALEVEDLTAQMAEVGKMVPGGLGALANGYAMMEMGVVRARNPIVQLIASAHLLKGTAKDVAAQLQKMTPEEQMKLGEKAIEKMADKAKNMTPTLGELATSFAGMKDQAFEALGVPLVESILPALGEVKTFLMDNKDAILSYLGEWGDFLGDTFNEVWDTMKEAFGGAKKDGADIKEFLINAGEFFKQTIHNAATQLEYVFKAIAFVIEKFNQVAHFLGDAAKAFGQDMRSGMLGEGLQKMMAGRDREKVGKEMEQLAGQPINTPEQREKLRDLEAQYAKLSETMGESGAATADHIAGINQVAEAHRVAGEQIAGAAMHLDWEQIGRKYNEAVKAHDEGMQTYIAGLITGSEKLSEALIKSTMSIEGGFAGVIKASRGAEGVTSADRERLAEQVKRGVGTKSGPPNIHIHGGVQIKQDFRDVDPDRVFLMFQKGLGDKAIARVQSHLSTPFSF